MPFVVFWDQAGAKVNLVRMVVKIKRPLEGGLGLAGRGSRTPTGRVGSESRPCVVVVVVVVSVR